MRQSRHSKVNAKRFFNCPYKLFELLFHTNTPYVQSIDGQRLSDDLLDFSENLKEKQVHYFKKALTISLENLRYDTLSMARGGFEDVREWYSSEEEDLNNSDSKIDD